MKREELRAYIERGDAAYTTRADRDIELHRKGDFELCLFEANGTPVSDATVTVEQLDIDFNFGASIFMLGEYADEARNRLYEKKFTEIFNTATIPLYWEGTEPREGYLRYDRGTPHDVYRRPPVQEVMDFCQANGLHMKGHPLFWHEFVAEWLPECYADLKPHIARRFAEIAKICGDQVESYDVVNEPSRIYDVHMRDRRTGRKHLVPDDDYCVDLFRLAKQHFPASKLILNDVTGAVFGEFRGKYSGFYLNVKDLLSRGVPIDEIGLQCHIAKGPEGAYNTEILYDILDTYASLGKTLNISEISIPSTFDDGEDEELQAEAAVRLYKACFSHPAMTGITWWNLPDDGVLTTQRIAAGENMPSTALLGFDYHEKAAYKALKKLIREEWHTNLTTKASTGVLKFRGFYGKYKIIVTRGGKESTFTVNLAKKAPTVRSIKL